MEVLRKYGAATTILFPLIDAGTNDFESTPVTFAAGDTKIIKDEGAAANTTNNPAHEGNGVYSLALTATEMQAARIVITIIDSATKTWEDQAIIISTYGNASGQHAFDLDTATQSVNVLQISGDSTAADNLEADYDGTGYAKTNSTIGTATSVTNQVTADMTAISGDTTAANNCESFFDNTGFTASNSTVGTVTTLTGHTAQTGDSFARLGAPAGASVSADIAAIEAQTDDIGVAGAGLSNIPWNASWDAEVQSEVNDALVALALDHLVSTSVTGTDVANNSIIARMVSSAATADWDTFVNTDDSLQAISESGGGGPTAADIADAVWDESTTGHTTAGTFGEQVKTDIDAILVDTSTTLDGKIDTVDGNVDAIKAKTDSLTFTVANHVDANALAISGDTTAADNLELMYDGTGYTDDTAPASRAQVAGIGAASGGSLNFEVQEDNTGGAIKGASFVGVQTGTFVNTEAEDGTLHTIDDTGNAIDIVYGFDIGGSRLATEVTFKGYLDSANDTITVQAYDFVGSDWETRTVITGQNGTDNITQTVPLLTKHTGTGTDLGKVYLRFVNSAQTNPQLNVDEFLCAAVASQATIGYAGGAVWLDTNASNTNTESFVDGTADNPVSTIAAARTIADNLNLKVIHCLPGSSFTLAQSFDDFEFIGFGYTVALGGQSVSGTLFRNATITGNDDGSNVIPTVYNLCLMGNNTLGTNKMNQCGFSGTITLAEAGTYDWVYCYSQVAGTGTPGVDVGAAVANTNLNARNYSGGMEVQNMGASGTDNMSFEGRGQLVINANCTGGTIAIRGLFTVTDNAGGAVTLSDDARYDVAQVNAEVVDALATDTYAEPGQEAPAATTTLANKINYLYKAFRNRNTQTADTYSLYADDATTVDQKATTSDDGTTFDRGEIGTGP